MFLLISLLSCLVYVINLTLGSIKFEILFRKEHQGILSVWSKIFYQKCAEIYLTSSSFFFFLLIGNTFSGWPVVLLGTAMWSHYHCNAFLPICYHVHYYFFIINILWGEFHPFRSSLLKSASDYINYSGGLGWKSLSAMVSIVYEIFYCCLYWIMQFVLFYSYFYA